MPTSTDLVTDLPADFEVFGQAVDTSLADLKGGTTGQVLAKASNTNMDFVWSTASGMTNPMTTTGDTIYSSSGSTPARLGIGSTGQVLTVSGGVPAWATASQKVVQIVAATYDTGTSNSTTTYADTGLTATITPTSASNKILVIWNQGGLQKTATNASSELELKLMRGATQIAAAFAGLTATALNNNPGNVGASILDSPATTSATTYKSQFRNGVNAASVVVQYNAGTSSLILMEVTP
jgi:hypothetical protein